MAITDLQIRRILDLTRSPREGMGTLRATDEELIGSVRKILDEKQLNEKPMSECIKEAILDPQFVAAFSEAFFNVPLKKPTFTVPLDGQQDSIDTSLIRGADGS